VCISSIYQKAFCHAHSIAHKPPDQESLTKLRKKINPHAHTFATYFNTFLHIFISLVVSIDFRKKNFFIYLPLDDDGITLSGVIKGCLS